MNDGVGCFCTLRNDEKLDWLLRTLPIREERACRAKRKVGGHCYYDICTPHSNRTETPILYGLSTCVENHDSNAFDYCAPRIDC